MTGKSWFVTPAKIALTRAADFSERFQTNQNAVCFDEMDLLGFDQAKNPALGNLPLNRRDRRRAHLDQSPAFGTKRFKLRRRICQQDLFVYLDYDSGFFIHPVCYN